MKTSLFTILFYFLLLFYAVGGEADKKRSYTDYHIQIIAAERHISKENYTEALNQYEEIFNNYDFIFLRDYKNASQIALYVGDKEKAFHYIKKGIVSGWGLKALNANKFLAPLKADSGWKSVEKEFDSLHGQYLSGIDLTTRENVHLMFKKDQKKAFGALFRIGEKARERYTLNKFAPHSECQLIELISILENEGYPGEQLIGNNYWMSTILSHHNSISQDYVRQDTLYSFIKPDLIEAIDKGQISPYEFAAIDDWYIAVSFDRVKPGYGFINLPDLSTLSQTNELRKAIGLRSVELRNNLIDVENKTGMNLNLPDWVEGKIIINQNE